jgi:hypothetical protein
MFRGFEVSVWCYLIFCLPLSVRRCPSGASCCCDLFLCCFHRLCGVWETSSFLEIKCEFFSHREHRNIFRQCLTEIFLSLRTYAMFGVTQICINCSTLRPGQNCNTSKNIFHTIYTHNPLLGELTHHSVVFQRLKI